MDTQVFWIVFTVMVCLGFIRNATKAVQYENNWEYGRALLVAVMALGVIAAISSFVAWLA